MKLALQSRNLVLSALGVLNDIPPNDIQPRLVDGVHLRWSFKHELGFPWYGFYLFRRPSKLSKAICLTHIMDELELRSGTFSSDTLNTPIGTFVSDRNLVFTDIFSPSGAVELDLNNRDFLRFSVPSSNTAYRVSARVGFYEQRDQSQKMCINFQHMQPANPANPLEERGVIFEIYAHDGSLRTGPMFAAWGGNMGLQCGFKTIITLPNATSSVDLVFSNFSGPSIIEALNVDGTVTQTISADPNIRNAPQTINLAGEEIVKVVIHSSQDETLLHQVCYMSSSSVSSLSVAAVGFDDIGNSYGPFPPKNNVINVIGNEIRRVDVKGKEEICIVSICANIGQDPVQLEAIEKMKKHVMDSIALWSQEGEVLEPHTIYRLKVITRIQAQGEGDLSSYSEDLTEIEYAFFRTGGPPGMSTLSVPLNYPKPDEFDSGLSDLVRYVEQTIPATVPSIGEKPILPRPVYRAYDVGVEFNENYVDLMYRLEHRGLALYLYDNNNRPVRDSRGRLIVLTNRWGKTDDLKLTESEETWITVVNRSNCAALDPIIIPHNDVLSSSGEGQVLAPDTIYEARLVPLLLHEDFGKYPVGTISNGPSGTLGSWKVHDEGANDGPSVWRIGETGGDASAHYLEQLSNIWSGTIYGSDPVKPGTLLILDNVPQLPSGHPDQPVNWSNYRLSVFVRSTDDDAIGVVFRYQGASYYRFSMDRERRYRRLTKVIGGLHTILAEDDFVYRNDKDYLVTVEAIGSSLRIYLDGELVFDISDSSLVHGSVGLYSWANAGSIFSDIRVDDFRSLAPVIYRFKFTTSRFVNFFHYLHSYQDETWRIELTSDGGMSASDIASLIAQAAIPSSPPSEQEAKAYQALAEKVLGSTAAVQQNPTELQVSRIEHDNSAIVLHVRGPEPIDWKRTSLEVYKAASHSSDAYVPVDVKITGVSFSDGINNIANDESVTILLRQATDLAGYRIEYYELPEIIDQSSEDRILFRDRFANNETSDWIFLDEGTLTAPSDWRIFGGHLRQASNIYSEPVDRNALDKLGTLAIAGNSSWDNVIVTAKLQSLDDGAIGLVFRYIDQNNYYRFSMDRQNRYRRLVKNVQGAFSLIWEDDFAYEIARPYHITIIAIGDTLCGYMDGIPVFVVKDPDLTTGRIGLYCWANSDARFSEIYAYRSEGAYDRWLLNETFAFLNSGKWIFVDEGDRNAPSNWQVTDGELRQTSNIFADGEPALLGTHGISGDPSWTDYRLSIRLRSDDSDGAIGILFRYQDVNNYYRFSMDRNKGYRRLVKKVNGTFTVLWEDHVQYITGAYYFVTVDCIRDNLSGYIDGKPIFSTIDASIPAGEVGLYCWANSDARFSEVRVSSPLWKTFYGFGNEGRLPAGTEVRIFSGNESDPYEAKHGILNRFRALSGEHGQARLPQTGTMLRVVSAPRKQEDGHLRYFMPDSAYNLLQVKVLRKRDGTGFFISVPSSDHPIGSSLEHAQYRMRMVYQRNNRANDPVSQVFSQAGISDPEEVVIDIPWSTRN